MGRRRIEGERRFEEGHGYDYNFPYPNPTGSWREVSGLGTLLVTACGIYLLPQSVEILLRYLILRYGVILPFLISKYDEVGAIHFFPLLVFLVLIQVFFRTLFILRLPRLHIVIFGALFLPIILV